MGSNHSYFIKRATQERSAAEAAQGKAREAHEAMAARYDALAQSAEEPEQIEPASRQPAPESRQPVSSH